MKKWILLFLGLCLLLSMGACKNKAPEDIVEELVGPEGIDDFAGLWYHEEKDLWIEVNYDGSWCSFEDGGMLRSHGPMTIDGQVGTLEPKEGEERFALTAADGGLIDEQGVALFRVTEVGVRKPLIVNDLGVPDRISSDIKIAGVPAPDLGKNYAGFYISEDGIFALEIFADGGYELQEYGLLIESGSLLCVTDPDYGQVYAVDTDSKECRLVIPQEERLYLGGCGAFAPGEKGGEIEE